MLTIVHVITRIINPKNIYSFGLLSRIAQKVNGQGHIGPYDKSVSGAYLFSIATICLILHPQGAFDQRVVTLNDVCSSSVKVISDHTKIIFFLSVYTLHLSLFGYYLNRALWLTACCDLEPSQYEGHRGSLYNQF